MASTADELEALTLWIRCPYCGEIGWCKSKGGKRSPLHVDRRWAIFEAYGLGFNDGVTETREAMEGRR